MTSTTSGAQAGERRLWDRPSWSTAAPARLWRDPWVVGAITLALAISTTYAFLAVTDFNSDDYLRWGIHFMNYWRGVEPEPILRTPGYPLFLAIVWKLGWGMTGVKIIQCLLVAGVGLMVAHMAELVAGRRAARWAAWTFCVYFPFLSFAAVGLTEVSSTFLMVLAVIATLRAVRRTDAWAWWVALACVCAIASTIVRPAQAFLLPVVIVALAVTAGSIRRIAAALVIAVATALVIFGPWVGRNLALDDKPMIFGNVSTYQFAQGIHLPADLSIGEFSAFRRSYRFFSGTRPDHFGPVQAAGIHPVPALVHNLEHHTGDMLWARAVAQFQMWPWPTTPRVQLGLRSVVPFALIMALHILIFGLGIVGLARARRTAVGRIGIAMIALTAIPYLVLYTSPRYTIVISPFFVTGAGVALSGITERIGSHRAATGRPVAADSPAEA